MKKYFSTTVLFVLLVIAIPLAVFAVVNWYNNRFETIPVYGNAGHHIADFTFTNQQGEKISSDAMKNKIVVADFFFTHCLSVCPKMTGNLKKVQEAYSKDDQVQIISFTVDPLADSSKQLHQYAEIFGIDNTRWQLLTGGKKEIYKLARNSFMVVATDGDGGPADFIHSEKLVLIDNQKRIRGYYDGTDEKEVQKLITDIKKLKHEI